MRLKRQQVEILVKRLNEIKGIENPEYNTVGAYHLEHGDGVYHLELIANKHGAAHNIESGSLQKIYTFIQGMYHAKRMMNNGAAI